jgi:hypothetical protein
LENILRKKCETDFSIIFDPFHPPVITYLWETARMET